MWDKFILGTREQTAKISKTGFANVPSFFQMFANVSIAVSKPQWVGVSSTKIDCDKFESWKNFFLHILAWAFFTRTTSRF